MDYKLSEVMRVESKLRSAGSHLLQQTEKIINQIQQRISLFCEYSVRRINALLTKLKRFSGKLDGYIFFCELGYSDLVPMFGLSFR